MTRSTDRSQDPSPFAWLMAAAVAAAGLGTVMSARRRRRAEADLWAAAQSDGRRRGSGTPERRADQADDDLAGHPS